MRRLFFLAGLLLAGNTLAQVTVRDAWVRATVPAQRATGAFMELTAAADSRLVEARSPVAGVAEVHEMTMEGDLMKMRALRALPLPAGRTVSLRPGSYHVMLLELKAPIRAGDMVPLTLIVERADGTRETLQVQATARALNAPAR